jgi:hypothetical protein
VFVPVDDEEKNALLAVVEVGAVTGADAVEPEVVADEVVDVPIEDVEVESIDETEAVPVTSRGCGLRPPAPSSVDPMGMGRCLTCLTLDGRLEKQTCSMSCH